MRKSKSPENRRKESGDANAASDLKSAVERAKKPVYLVPAVDKALRILELLKSQGSEMTIAEIARATGWHKSTIQKLLVTLDHHGVVERDAMTKRYMLGITLAEYGRVALNNLDIRHSAKAFLKELVDSSGETAVLAILHGTKMVMVDKKEPLVQIRASPFIGTRFPATATANGKALLAWLPEEQVLEIMKTEGLPAFTKNSTTKAAAYRKELTATRERGFAIDQEEFQEGVSGVSAPVFNLERQVIATLSLVGPAFRMTEDKLHDYGKLCVQLSAQLSTKFL